MFSWPVCFSFWYSCWFPDQIVSFRDKTNHLIIIGYYMACNIQTCLFSLPILTSSINTEYLINHEIFISFRNETDCSLTLVLFITSRENTQGDSVSISFTLYGVYSNIFFTFVVFYFGNHVCDPALGNCVAFSRILLFKASKCKSHVPNLLLRSLYFARFELVSNIGRDRLLYFYTWPFKVFTMVGSSL